MEQFVVGIIRGSHGLTGKLKIESTSGECEHFFDMTEVTVRKSNTEKIYKVESVEGSASNLIMKLQGIETPEQAKTFNGAEILVPRDKACPLYEGQYYVEDLKQCALVYSAKEGLAENSAPTDFITVGKITDVLEGGANDLLQVSLSESVDALLNRTDKDGTNLDASKKAPREVLVPFQKEFIGTVDIQNKVIHLMHLWILE